MQGNQMNVIGIDPGANTGLAFYEDGKLVDLQTIEPTEIMSIFPIYAGEPLLIAFEDSRLQSHVWVPSQSKGVAANIARKIGMVDAWCYMIERYCEQYDVAYMRISPKAKGEKLNAEHFKRITAWTGKSNQHERDAAMVAWQFRSKK
jgi:predicted RNase H-like nuclease (RuvC/YqgF family)